MNIGLVDKLCCCFLSVQGPVDENPKIASFLQNATALLHGICQLCFAVSGRWVHWSGQNMLGGQWPLLRLPARAVGHTGTAAVLGVPFAHSPTPKVGWVTCTTQSLQVIYQNCKPCLLYSSFHWLLSLIKVCSLRDFKGYGILLSARFNSWLICLCDLSLEQPNSVLVL